MERHDPNHLIQIRPIIFIFRDIKRFVFGVPIRDCVYIKTSKESSSQILQAVIIAYQDEPIVETEEIFLVS